MRNLQKPLRVRGWKTAWPLLVAGVLSLMTGAALAAAPANDNFAAALDLSSTNGGLFGTVSMNTTNATAEAGEPNHAGFVTFASVWYKWTAPQDGEVQLDTLSSTNDTVLAVYTGSTVSALRQVAANDDLFPIQQFNASGQNFITQPFNGPSALRFNAKQGTTYYFAVASKLRGGQVVLGWAYHSAGVFRFATEDAVNVLTRNTNTVPPSFQFQTLPVYKASEWESSATEDASTYETYYQFGVPGLLVTVTRLGGASGRMLVDYATEDFTVAPIPFDAVAHSNVDYIPVKGTLVFDDYEMTKRILITIQPDGFLARSNRDFAIVLSNARPDAAETPNLAPPRIDGGYGRAIIQILDTDIDPVRNRNFQADTNVPPIITYQPTNSVFNISRVAYRTTEDVNGYWTHCAIWVDRSGTNTEGETIHYRFNNFLGAGDDAGSGEEDNNYFPLQPGSDYATPHPTDAEGNSIGIHGSGADFNPEVSTSNYKFPGGGTLTWPANDFRSRAIEFDITNDTLVEFNEDLHVFIYVNDSKNNNAPRPPGTISEANVTIMFDDNDPPAGSVDQFHNPDFGANMVPPVVTSGDANRAHPGADSVVYGLVVQPDDKTVVVGDFLTYNAATRNRIARINVDGSVDTSFTPGAGANNFINAIVRTSAGQFVIGGGFSSYNGIGRAKVARLNSNGGLDATFNPVAPNGTVWAVAVQPDGKVIIAGDFTSVGGMPRARIARLESNGSLDATFDPGVNDPDGTIWSLALQTDGKVVIGGEFSHVGGDLRGGIARLDAFGVQDPGFNPGAGTDGIVYSLALESGKILVGGAFHAIDFNPRNNLTRLNADGTLDLTFDPGSTGTDDTVYSITPSGAGIYIGGAFTVFNGTHRMGMARLYNDGTLDTGFLDPAYNQFAGLHRARFSDAPGIVFASGVQSDAKLMIVGSFEQVGGGQNNDPLVRPDTLDLNQWTEPKSRDGVRNRRNVARLIAGSTPGPGNIRLADDNTVANENGSSLSVNLVRENGTLGYLSANFQIEEGLMQGGVDYIYNAVPPIYLSSWRLGFPASEPHPTTRMHSDGLFSNNFVPTSLYGQTWNSYLPGELVITLLNDSISQGDRNASFRLSNPTAADQFYLGGENIPLGGALGLSQAPFTILDDDKNKGVLGFAPAAIVVNENVTNALITVTRTNGSFGTVSCQFTTIVGGTALAGGADYFSTNGTLTFGPGVTSRSFTIRIVDDSSVENDETIFLRLSGPGGGAALGATNATLTIIDNDTVGGKLNFSSAAFSTNENSGVAVITVARSGSSSGSLTVQVAATNGTALNGLNFTALTNTLSWADGEVASKTLTVPLIDDVQINVDRTVNLRLFNPTRNGSANPATLGVTTAATLTILNEDFSGQVAFSASVYKANENGGPAIITLVRAGGSAESVSVNFSTSGGTAVPGVDYTATSGTLNFGPGELSKSFSVPIIDNLFPDAARFITMTLSGGALGLPSTAIINLIDDESVNEPPGGLDTMFRPDGMNDAVLALALQSDGKIIAAGDFTVANSVPRLRMVRLNAVDGSVDGDFQASANETVRSLIMQGDGKVVMAGAFTTVGGVVRNHIARVNSNGSLDTSFNPGPGSDNPLFAAAEAFVNSQRKLYIGGGFTTFNNVGRNGIARLNNDGTLDTEFNPPLGANGTVYAVAAYPTNTTDSGKVLIAGDFTAVNGVGCGGIARLNADGSLDPTFNPGSGANAAVRAIALQSDGRILIGGSFTNYSGTTMNHFARLNANGTLDATFTPGVGANDTVDSITVQGDTRIVLGGQFTRCNGVTRNHVTRLNSDGTVDPTINFGSGANNFVAATLVQPDGKIVIGGGFTEYDGTGVQRIARIYGGSIAGSGTLEFTAADYSVAENGTNALITVRRRGGTSGSPNIAVDVVATDGTATSGINYLGATNTLVFPPGEVLLTLQIPVIDDFDLNQDRTLTLNLQNLQPAGGAPAGPDLGNQPVATLTIVNDDSAISFDSPTYTVSENVLGGVAGIRVIRSGATAGTATVDFLTTTNGTATAGLDYTTVTNALVFNPGESVKTLFIPIVNDLLVEGNETVAMALTNASGALMLAPTEAVLTIVDDDFAPGQILFAQSAFTVAENGGPAAITLVRTNGRTGVVSVNLTTTDVTANAPLDYTAMNVSVSFGDGETNKTVLIPINDDLLVEGPETFNVTLTNATGGATILGSNVAPVTILDDEVGATFSSPTYVVNEAGPSVTISVLRINGSNGVASVHYATADSTAIAGQDFTDTSGTLTFANGETLKTFTVPITDDSLVEGDESFQVVLSNPSPGLVILNGTSRVTILDNDPGLTFAPTSYVVSEAGTNVILTVVRTNASTGTVTVSYGTTNGTATAGADYVGVAGVITFTNGEVSKTITVPINNDTEVEGDETFTVALSNPTGGAQLVGTTVADVTIVDNDSGLRFSSANYSLIESGVAATITVQRTGVLTNTVTVAYSTSDGTATNGMDYLATSGTLTFTNGETAKTFTVTVIDDTIVEGAETVLLKLTNPTDQASLLTPNAATLTIVDNDGGSILPAGVLLTAENSIINGAVEPGETVTALFALRNVSGVNTTNLVATLLVTNGVTAPSAAQNYGALVNAGASASRSFTFTAAGTNGGTIFATFQVQDGSVNFGTVTFNFLLGTATTTLSNLSLITINDANGTPAAATPYPSVINVSGLGGSVSKAVVTLTNLAHTHPNDIDILLAGPASQSMILMSDAGGGNTITNVTVTFDDAAAGSLPFSGAIVSGTNKPTNYLLGDSFPAPAPAEPYGATLATFNGSNPNGQWGLYLVDDTALDVGSLRGWFLTLTTSGLIPAAADLSVTMNAAPLPAIVSSNLTYTVAVTNHGPWSATGILLNNDLPLNASYVSSGASAGSISTNGGGQVVWTIGSLARDGTATATITVRPAAAVTISSTSTVLAAESDPNSGNNIATVLTAVSSPTADLTLGLVGSPNPVFIGQNLLYSLFVTNRGPATATGVSLTNTLPPGVTFLSASPAGYTLVGSVITFTNLGNAGSGLVLSATISVHPNVPATLTSTAVAASGVIDPLKGNNTATVKTIVTYPPLETSVVGSNLVISWSAAATDYSLESATDLTPPVVWTPVTVPPPVLVGGQKVVTNAIGTGSKFFRLRAALP